MMIAAGCCAGIQSSVNTLLGKQIGVFEGGFVSFIGGTIIFGLLVAFFGKGNLASITQIPYWQLIGGLLGAYFVASVIISVPNIGVASVMVGAILGQLIIAILIDHFGWFNVVATPISFYRIIGVIFVLTGVLCIFKR